jgi:3',5'-cyclic AMP phosphodiesterase CpdA
VTRLLLLLVAALVAACRAAPAGPCPQYCGDVTIGCGEFVVCGDSRGHVFGEFWRPRTDDERRAIFAQLAEEAPDFIVNTGDLVADGSDLAAWAQFDREAEALRDRRIPYIPVLGNHDLWPHDEQALANWFARFPFLDGRRWFNVRYGSIDLVVIDSNADALTPRQIEEQEAWYRERLAADDADPEVRLVVVALHHSPYTNSYLVGNSEWVARLFVGPARASRKARLFFTGHVHSYEHFLVDGVHFVVSGGGGAPLMDVAGRRGRFRDLYSGPRRHHYCRVIPRDDRVDVQVVMRGDAGGWTIADAFSVALP